MIVRPCVCVRACVLACGSACELVFCSTDVDCMRVRVIVGERACGCLCLCAC